MTSLRRHDERTFEYSKNDASESREKSPKENQGWKNELVICDWAEPQ
jgi:hypothetical protein